MSESDDDDDDDDEEDEDDELEEEELVPHAALSAAPEVNYNNITLPLTRRQDRDEREDERQAFAVERTKRLAK